MRLIPVCLLRSVAAYLGVLVLMSCVPTRVDNIDSTFRSDELIDAGVVQLRAGRLREAQAAFEVAEQLTGDNPAAVDGKGCVALMRGEFEEAERLFWKAYHTGQYDDVLSHLALLYELKGEKEQARLFFEEAVRRNPGSFRARNNRAAFLFHTNENINDVHEELLRAAALSNAPRIQMNLAVTGRSIPSSQSGH